MNAADARLLRWLSAEIKTGIRTAVVPADLLRHTTDEGLREARALAKLSGVKLVVHG